MEGREKDKSNTGNKRTGNKDAVNKGITERPRQNRNQDPLASSEATKRSNKNALISFKDEDRPRIIHDLTMVDLKDVHQDDEEDEV